MKFAVIQKAMEYKTIAQQMITVHGMYLIVAKKMLKINNLGVTRMAITGPTIR